MAPTSSVSLSVRELTKRYGAVEAVRGVSFDVAPGEIFGLLGPNGSGKTSTIECILGLREPDSGSVTLHGIDALAHPAQSRRVVGAQLQFASLHDKITPREALNCFAAFYPESAPVEELLTQFLPPGKTDVPFDSLSGGQKQRLFLALALVNRPHLLVLDEPTAGLDPLARRDLHEAILQLKSAGRSILLSTHYLEEAHQLCDRIGILHAGRLVALGTPDELIARSRALPRLTFRTLKPVDHSIVGALPAVTASESHEGGSWMVSTTQVNQTISSLVQKLDADGNEMLDLEIHRPSLEEVFMELTSTAWTESP